MSILPINLGTQLWGRLCCPISPGPHSSPLVLLPVFGFHRVLRIVSMQHRSEHTGGRAAAVYVNILNSFLRMKALLVYLQCALLNFLVQQTLIPCMAMRRLGHRLNNTQKWLNCMFPVALNSGNRNTRVNQSLMPWNLVLGRNWFD